jgi:hypothetical protein
MFRENTNPLYSFKPKDIFQITESKSSENASLDNTVPDAPVCIKSEIAQINIKSRLGDLYCITAEQMEESVVIDVYDEYEQWYCGYRYSYDSIPTQGEVFEIIRDMHIDEERKPFTDHPSPNYWIQIIEMNELKNHDDILKFIDISSPFYPDLSLLFSVFLRQNGYG